MAVKVEQVTKTKSGKGLRVMLSGTWYNAFLDSGLDKQIGNLIEAEIQVHDRFGPGVVAWKPIGPTHPQAAPHGSPSPVPPLTQAPAAAAPKFAEPSDNIQPWWAPFMSNMCAHAIQAGLCKAPEELNQWALKAAQVAVATKEAVK